MSTMPMSSVEVGSSWQPADSARYSRRPMSVGTSASTARYASSTCSRHARCSIGTGPVMCNVSVNSGCCSNALRNGGWWSKRADQFPVAPDPLPRDHSGRLQQVERAGSRDIERRCGLAATHDGSLVGHPTPGVATEPFDGRRFDAWAATQDVAHLDAEPALVVRSERAEEVRREPGPHREHAVGSAVEPVDQTPTLQRVDVQLHPAAPVPRVDALEEPEERLVVVVAKEVVARARQLAGVAFAAGLPAFPVEVVVVVDDYSAGGLRGEHGGEPERDVAGVGVRVDGEQEPDVVVLDVADELFGEHQGLPPHLARQLARLLAVGGEVLVEQAGEPHAVVPLVPAVGAGQVESMPRRFEHHVGPVAEVPRNAMDRHRREQVLEAPRVLRDLHRDAVDVVRERDERDAAPDGRSDVVRPWFGMMPSQVVEDRADAAATVDVTSLKLVEAHQSPRVTGSLGRRCSRVNTR